MKAFLLLTFLSFIYFVGFSQENTKEEKKSIDSLYIHEYEDLTEPDKVLHAEPLYIDLIRDLGARKGEKEWNVGFGITDNVSFDSYEALVEYEFAPINRLGLEFELPFTFYTEQSGFSKDSIPGNRLDAIKLAAQWSFFVSEKISTSMALGYIHEFVTNDFNSMSEQFFIGNAFNPFFVIAKRWGRNFHTLIYTGPIFEKEFNDPELHSIFEINTNLHYMIRSTRNFIGLEINQQIYEGELNTVLRPQMRVDISEQLLIGIVVGIPVEKKEERMSAFLRLIWEPSVLH